MTYTELLPPGSYRSPDWYDQRKHGISASEIAAVLSLSPYESPWALWHRKKGLLDPQPDNDAMEWGRRIEELIVAKFTERHATEFVVRDVGLVRSSERLWQLATPDAVCCDFDAAPAARGYEPVAGVEAKTADSWDGWGDEGSDDIPVYYRCQTLWQMDVLGVDCVYVPALSRGKSYREYVIVRDDAAQADLEVMREAAREFLASLDGDEPPPLDSHPATTDTLKALHPDLEDVEVVVAGHLAAQYKAACADLRHAEEWKRELDNRLLRDIGDAKRAVTAAGDKVATRSVFERTSIDTRKLRADHPAIAKACEKTATVTQLRPAPQPKPKETIR